MLANQGDQRLHRARQAAVTAITQAQFAPQIDAFDAEQLDFTGFHLVASKAFADKGDAGIRTYEALDHANAWQLHADANARTVRAKELVQHLPSETGTRQNKRLRGNFIEREFRAVRH